MSQVIFTGTYEHTIDAKNRLAIPSDLRNAIQREAGATGDEPVVLYLMPLDEGPDMEQHARPPALCLYTEQAFERRSEQLDHAAADPDELLDYELDMYPDTYRVTLDKQGRIRLPEPMIAEARLGSEVVLLGVKDHLQVRDRAAWREYRQQRQQRAGRRVNPRRLMHRPPSD